MTKYRGGGRTPMATATAAKTKLKIFPLADRVAIRPMEETETMKGGLYIHDTAKEKQIQGEGIAAGPGRRENDALFPMELKVGDRWSTANTAALRWSSRVKRSSSSRNRTSSPSLAEASRRKQTCLQSSWSSTSRPAPA